jgi:DNA mismatch repair protein MutS2
VLHGHGTGALKSAVRELLSELSWVQNAEPATREQGGDALTVFSLRE